MKLLLNCISIGLLGMSLLSEANAIEIRDCPFGGIRSADHLGRITCQSSTGSGSTSICFTCPPQPSQLELDQLCNTVQPEHCSTGRCSAHFLESCKRSCAAAQNLPACKTPEGAAECSKLTGCQKDCDNQKKCENNCEEFYKKNCTKCTAMLMEGCVTDDAATGER